eukprot:CCRYP_000042-RA/>CCRYP_000042-RA protein AED:0.02 eAED:0.02 QI:589/1/1/1/1/1/2/137/864
MTLKRSRPTTATTTSAASTAAETACSMLAEAVATTTITSRASRRQQRRQPIQERPRRVVFPHRKTLATAVMVTFCPSFAHAQTTTTSSAATTMAATSVAGTLQTSLAATTTMSQPAETIAATMQAGTTSQSAQGTPPATEAAQVQHECPPLYSGWAPSSNCASYFWCSNGQLASIPYDCVEGTLFDADQLTCLPAEEVDCLPVAATTTSTTIAATATLGPGVTESVTSTASPTPPPTPRPTSLGPAIYFVDFPSQSCKTDSPPDWITPDQLFTTKEECCNVMMDWIPLETCLGGANYTETNFYWAPTESPTESPSWSPTDRPSEAPSVSPSSSEPTVSPSTGMPTVGPTLVPTASPNNSPTQFPTVNPTLSPSQFMSDAPTLSPTTESPTPSPTIDPQILLSAQLATASKVENTYLVDLIGWANEGMESYSIETFSTSVVVTTTTESPTPSPSSSSSAAAANDVYADDVSLMTLILPVIADATISKQRPQVNFGSHQALAVDGGDPSTALGDSVGEKFDTLLKFDVSLVDWTRPVESATLRLYIVEGCKSGGTLSTTMNTEWESDTVTWENAPVADGVWIGRLPPVVAGQWYDVDVTSALASLSTVEEEEDGGGQGGEYDRYSTASSSLEDGGYLSLRFESDENSRCLYSSMESGDSVSPRLVVQYMEQNVIARDDTLQENVEEEPSLSPPVIGDFLLLKATDDATVVGNNPTRNFGSEPNLLIAFDTGTRGIFDTLIRFDLRELVSTPPRTAVLSLYAETDCDSAGTFATTSGDDDWTENQVTWATAPMYEPQNGSNAGGTSLGVFGSVKAETWNAFNVLNAIKDAIKLKKSAVTFRLSSGNSEPCQFSSRDGGRAPKLMVAF